ncbi:hypothetical protein H0E87_005887 [Populus deltoides]|uniref:DNA (cytosine-5-)-methyltransferase n=1 Tax=Populus deltoides TaxID=3696 RepID=A0A8T2Z558_POPDE|nr:hypothetical protein H0E87_005887 [Populus deltoides]
MPRKRQRSTTTKPEAAASTSSIKQKKTAATPKRTWLRKVEKEEEEEEEVFVLEGDEDDTNSVDEVGDRMGTGNADSRLDTKEKRGSGKAEKKISTPVKVKEDETPARFVGAQIPGAEARKKWSHRYATKASDGEPDYICRISEMFDSVDRTLYFTTQWCYRSTDTIIKDKYISDPKCVFFSEIRNDNPLECLTWKLNIVRLALNVDPENRRARSSGCDFYCDMLYLLPYSTFVKLPTENNTTGPESSTISNDIDAAGVKSECDEVCETSGSSKSEVALLDLYSGCGAMSTGLCLGLNLVTKWAVDLNMNACQRLRLNHPETQGDVDVICGGPPCQGISGFNRFRNTKSPLDDPKNKQLIVFMDTVDFLRPKFVLMENVVDLLKFADGFIGRYAMGCLANIYEIPSSIGYAGAYGLPQFRMRVFLWGACATEKPPQYPLPTHDVLGRGIAPVEFEGNTVAYEEGVQAQLENKLFLKDAISDLPAVTNSEMRDEMPYGRTPTTEFQHMIRLKRLIRGARALRYALGRSFQGLAGDDPVFSLPK